MTRLTLGAITLIDAVIKKWEDATVEYGEPDGLGVRRAIKFDEVTSKELSPALHALNDPRIATLKDDEEGLIVVFVDTYRADTRLPFDLDTAAEVAEAESSVTELPEIEDSGTKATVKKSPAKKTTSKKS